MRPTSRLLLAAAAAFLAGCGGSSAEIHRPRSFAPVAAQIETAGGAGGGDAEVPVSQCVAEDCSNGEDDDCDGRVDHGDDDCSPTVHTCEESEGGGCNGDLGHGDRCDPQDNTGGCSPARFWAWCNRRNPEYPNIWDDWIRNWVDARCDGSLAETGTQYSTWFCTSSSNDRYECTTPLVLSFDGAPVELSDPGPSPFAFTRGAPVHSSWPRPSNPWLVRDVNGNGLIDDGAELFGSNTVLPTGARAVHGFAALAELDADGDGVVGRRDPAFHELKLWADVDGDRVSDEGELRTLDEAGVAFLSLRYTVAPRCDRRGNCERERAAFLWRDRAGRAAQGAVVDVYLATRAASDLRASAGALTCRSPSAVSGRRAGR